VHDGTRHGFPPSPVVAADDAIVATAERAEDRENLRFEDGILVPEDVPADSRARLVLDVPAGYWRFDLVHPALAPDVMGSVRLTVAGQRLDMRPEPTPEEIERGHVVTPIGSGYLNGGRREIVLGGPFFVGFSHLVLTPLADDHPLAERLEARAEAELEGRLPALRAFIGTRTDDGMDYATFDRPRTVDAALGDAREYVFHGRLENLPIPEPDSGDVAELSGICVLGVWNDHLVTARDRTGPPLLIESLEFEAPWHPVWPPESRARIFHASPNRADDEVYTREVLAAFLPRAFRRPVAQRPALQSRYVDAPRPSQHGLGGPAPRRPHPAH
jgi:hypothetical protein